MSKPLSFREKRMLERARYLVISELSIVCRKSECVVEPLVDQALRQSCMKHTRTVPARQFSRATRAATAH
jgi:CarD family transcriptional regulator